MLTSSRKNTIAKKIVEDIKEPPHKEKLHVRDFCVKKLEKYEKKLSELEVNEVVDGIVKKVRVLWGKYIDDCYGNNLTPEYVFSTLLNNVLINYSVHFNEPQPLIFLRKQKDKILKLIREQMAWRSFESLCKHILKNDGIDKLVLTKDNQEGIDFIGVLNTGNHIKLDIIPNNCKIKVVGQAKRYKHKIKPERIRAFETYCQDIAVNKDKDLIRKLPRWFKDMKSPVVGIFMTTSDYTKRALQYPQGDWKILKNGQQIVELIIKSPESQNWITEKNGHRSFDDKAFLETFQKE